MRESLGARETRSFLLTLATAAAIFAAALYAAERYGARRNLIERETRMSVFNSGSSGTMALREFLERTGRSTGRIMRSMDRFELEAGEVPVRSPGLILICEPELPLQKKEIFTLAALAARGYFVVVASSGEEKMAGILHTLSADKHPKVRGGMYLHEVRDAAAPLAFDRHGSFRDVKGLELPGRQRFRTWNDDWRVFVSDRQGALALEKGFGGGGIVLVSDGAFLSNLNLGKADNGLFIYRLVTRLAGPGTVNFDEFHHGYSRRFTLLYFLALREYLAIVAQTVIFLLAVVFASAVTFGQYRTPRRTGEEKIFYYTEGMARLIEDRRFSNDVAALIVSNYRKSGAVKRGGATPAGLKRLEEFEKGRREKRMGRRAVKEIYKIIRGESDGDKGVR